MLQNLSIIFQRYLTSIALSHQFIWSSTSFMLCFIFSGGRSLDWPSMAGNNVNNFKISLAFSRSHNLYPMLKFKYGFSPSQSIFTVGNNVCYSYTSVGVIQVKEFQLPWLNFSITYIITHGQRRCLMQKNPFLDSGSGTRAGWDAALPSPPWQAQAQQFELPSLEGCLASHHHPWLSLA